MLIKSSSSQDIVTTKGRFRGYRCHFKDNHYQKEVYWNKTLQNASNTFHDDDTCLLGSKCVEDDLMNDNDRHEMPDTTYISKYYKTYYLCTNLRAYPSVIDIKAPECKIQKLKQSTK